MKIYVHYIASNSYKLFGSSAGKLQSFTLHLMEAVITIKVKINS